MDDEQNQQMFECLQQRKNSTSNAKVFSNVIVGVPKGHALSTIQ
jgi:hypothetical protein